MIVKGTIGPIHVKDLHNIGAVTLTIPMPVEEAVHIPQLVSAAPVVVAQETLDHAKECAQRVVSNIHNLPHTEQAGDLLAMAFTILHYSKGK